MGGIENVRFHTTFALTSSTLRRAYCARSYTVLVYILTAYAQPRRHSLLTVCSRFIRLFMLVETQL